MEGELDKLVINARPAEGEHPPKEDSCDRVKDCVRPSIHQVWASCSVVAYQAAYGPTFALWLVFDAYAQPALHR